MKTTSKIIIFGHNDIVERSLYQYFHKNARYDAFSSSEEGVQVLDPVCVASFFEEMKPEYVILTSVRSGGIGANQAHPAEFIYENLQAQNNVIHLAHVHKVKKLLFLAASCVYPKDCSQPMKEDYFMNGAMEKTSEPYSMAKAAGIVMCQAYRKQYGMKAIVAVPATVYGTDPADDIKQAHVIGAMVEKFYRAVRAGDKDIQFWGTGRPRREFIYAEDLADACAFLLENYDGEAMLNVGTGEDIAVADLAAIIKDVSGFQGDILWDDEKPDGALRKLLDSSRLKEIGWQSKVSLREGIKKTYETFVGLKQ